MEQKGTGKAMDKQSGKEMELPPKGTREYGRARARAIGLSPECRAQIDAFNLEKKLSAQTTSNGSKKTD